MNVRFAVTLLIGSLVGSCADEHSHDDIAGGGFETSDLQVSIVDDSGNDLVGARAWLLGSTSTATDTLDVSVDSGLSDHSGKVRFPRGSLADEKMGIEAWSGDTMFAIHSKTPLANRDTITIVLRRARILTLPCMAFPTGTVLQMPGSHFAQRPPPNCRETFRILVPSVSGFLLAFMPHSRPPLHVYYWVDTLPPFRPSGMSPTGNGPPPYGVDSSRFLPPMPMP